MGLMGRQGGPQGMLLQEGASVPGQTPGDLGWGCWAPHPLTIPPSNLSGFTTAMESLG